MTDDERKTLLHTVYVVNLFLEKLGQFELAQQYNENVGPHVKRIVEAMKIAQPVGDEHAP